MGRLDSMQGEMTSISQAISRLQETVNLLVERQGQQDVASDQDRAESDDEADKLLLDFVRQPRTTTGKVRNSTKSDVEAAILALVNGNVEEQQKKLAGINKHVDTAISRMKMMVPRNKVPHSWTLQDRSIRDAITELLLDLVSKNHPFVPLDACEKNWIARYFLVQKWNNIHTRDDNEESMVVTNKSRQRSLDRQEAPCRSVLPWNLGRLYASSQFRALASVSHPAALPPALTWEVSMYGIPSVLVVMPVPTAAPPTAPPPRSILCYLLDDLNPNGLYYPRIFLWLPHLLLEKLGKTLKYPMCNYDLKSKGYTDKPRRVVDITERGVSKTVGDLLRPCMQNSVGPKRFQKILRELHKLKHARSEFQYLNAAMFRIESPTIDQYFISNSNNVLCSFSDFDDKNGYDGFIPSPQYFHSFYTSYTEEIRHLLDKQMLALDAKYLKGDYSFKIIKRIGNVDGAPIFTALYTTLNEYKEVRLQFLVPATSLFHLKGDKNILEDVFPPLKEALQPVTDSKLGRVMDYSQYPKLTIPGDSVEIRCINEADEIASGALELLDFIKTPTSSTSEPM
ncbi:hypothetical protein INT45_001912 [Circinella minor]|uniref:Uncharacterized protein n=1 Tax=Circinella minor TaxID=1195481 RepID=A0A8H7RT13_9FUNG|nr:hypothetical protein INT45_001912 [Circinella minor]